MKKKSNARRQAHSLCGFEALEQRRLFAFGLTTTSTTFVVDTGGGLVFTVLKNGASTSSTIHLGDMTSVKYNGTETLATYAQSSRYSHYEQGLSSSSVISAIVDPSATPQWIMIKCDDSALASGAVIHYYIAKRGEANIYMASLPIDVTKGPGEGRYIAYMSRPVLSNVEDPSDTSTTNATVEGSDVFKNTTTGITKSKFYNTRDMIDNTVHGLTGNTTPGAPGVNIGAFMNMGNREHSAGGPFFKDIDFQSTGPNVSEMYNCVFTGHTQTETYRQGLQGPYAMQYTNGSAPATLDYSWLEGVGIQGLIPASQRGAVSGTASGITSGNLVTVGLSNSTAQYWTRANQTTGAYSIAGVLPGTYTETLYDKELEVGTRTITVTAGATTSADIVSTYFLPAATWRIGSWDGTPDGFLNADKIAIMHPSDTRMAPFVSSNFVIGTNTDAQWPLAQFMDINNAQRITFTLTAAQVAAQTLRIGITLGFEGGRNVVTVNSGQSYAWTSSIPTASRDLNSRGITRGTYRGPNQLYTYNIPASALRAGTNTIDLPVASGSYVAGQGFLSPNVVYDAIDLVPTSTLTNAPRVATITLSPTNSRVPLGTQITYTATAKDQFGNPIVSNIDFATTGGTITPAGVFTAQQTSGVDTITVTSGGIVVTAKVTVIGPIPLVATAASASPNPTATGTTVLTVLGDDDGGEAGLTYTWSVVGTPPGSVAFSANGTNASKTSTATFSAYGNYTLLVTIADATGNSVTSQVTVGNREFVARYPVDAEQSGDTILADTSGGDLDATLSGSYSFVAGRSGNALKLSGGVADLPDGVVSTLNDFTIASWVKVDSFNTWARIFDFGTGTTNYMFLSTQYTTTSPNAAKPRFAIRTASVAEQAINSTTALTVGTWYHIAVTLSGSTARLYINGVLSGSNTAMTLKPSSLGITTANYLGDSQFSGDPSLFGSIDEFRIYGRALSAAELAAITTPTPAGVTVSPDTATIGTNTKQQYSAAVIDQFGNPLASPTVTWSASAGTINSAGLFTAPATPGSYTVTATSGGVNDSASIGVVAQQYTSLAITPTTATITTGAQQQFVATALDQFGTAMVPQPAFSWSNTGGGGAISSTGLFTAGSGAGGPFTVTASTPSLSSVTSSTTFGVSGTPTAPTSTRDLGTGGMIVEYSGAIGTQLSDAINLIKTGRGSNAASASGVFDYAGLGITSSTAGANNAAAHFNKYAVGVINNADLALVGQPVYTSFGGVQTDATSVLMRYTIAGDANLDGKIDFSDYALIGAGFNGQIDASHGWGAGDFNLDGVVNADDYAIIDFGKLTQGAAIAFGTQYDLITASVTISAARSNLTVGAPSVRPPLTSVGSGAVATVAPATPSVFSRSPAAPAAPKPGTTGVLSVASFGTPTASKPLTTSLFSGPLRFGTFAASAKPTAFKLLGGKFFSSVKIQDMLDTSVLAKT